MKSILTLFIVSALSVTGQADTDAVLRGIRIVETQDQLHPPRGKLGERGPYQFRRSTWQMHTSSSFALAENRAVANSVAKRHYAWLESELRASGVVPSPYNVALAWNAGVHAVIRGNAPAVAHDYATRVLNVAATFEEHEQPAPAPLQPLILAVDTPFEDTNHTPAPIAEPSSSSMNAITSLAVVDAASGRPDDFVPVHFTLETGLSPASQTPNPIAATPKFFGFAFTEEQSPVSRTEVASDTKDVVVRLASATANHGAGPLFAFESSWLAR